MKKFLSVLLAVIMILSVSAITASAQTIADYAVSENEGATADSVNGTSIGYVGDADMSDDISIKDATAIQKSIAKLVTFTDTQELLADADLSGDISIKDATAIQKWIAKIEVTAPVYHLLYTPVINSDITGSWETDVDLANVINDSLPLYTDDPLLLEHVNISAFPAKVVYTFTEDGKVTVAYDEATMTQSLALVKKELEGDFENYLVATIKEELGMTLSIQQILGILGYDSMSQFVDEMFPMDMVEDMTTPMTGTYRVDGNKLYMTQDGTEEVDYYETFTVADGVLTFTGNSEGTDYDDMYPIVFYAIK